MLEYLIAQNRLESARCFHEKNQRSLSEEMMSLFAKGQREKFMQIYCLLRKQSKLEFYLRVYFLIFHIHPALKAKSSIPQEQTACFKEFIDNRGAELAKTNEFLEFYALPYIKKPLEHLAFKNLFKKEWVSNLKQKLKIYLNQQEKRIKHQASKFCEGSNSSIIINEGQKVKEMERINRQLFEEVHEFKEKYKFLEESQKNMIEGFHSHMMESQSKWFQIVKELVGCSKWLITSLIKSQSACTNDRKFIKIRKRTQKYEKFVNRKFDDLMSQSQDISIFEKASVNELSTFTQKSMTGFINLEEYLPTNFEEMKRNFWKKDTNEKIIILNGLFWRVAKCKDLKSRRMNIIGILSHDLLGVQSGSIDELLAARQLMKPTLRLLNAISMDKYGRWVIFTNTHMYRDILALVNSCSDQTCLQYIMIIIEFLSAQSGFKKDLLSNDIVSILIGLLWEDTIARNQVIVQNIVATLLNLTDSQEGIKLFQQESSVFSILQRYLQTDYMITKVIAYAIIYSLLEDQQMWNLAHQTKLPQFISYLHNKNPHTNKKQIQPILQKLRKFQPKPTKKIQEQPEQSDEEDLYEYDIEEESMEEYVRDHEEIVRKFTLKGKEAKKQLTQIKETYEEFSTNKLPKFYQPQSKRNDLQIQPKINNFFDDKSNPTFRVKEEKGRNQKKLKKNTSQERLSNKQKPKPVEDRNYRSPHKKSREEVLKQLNDQLKASEREKGSNHKNFQSVREDRLQESKKDKSREEVEAFQSKPKLRRTPPHDD